MPSNFELDKNLFEFVDIKREKEKEKLTRIIRRIIPITSHQRNRVSQERPRHRVPTTNPASQPRLDRLLGLKARVEFEVVNVSVQFFGRAGDSLVWVPFGEGAEFCEAEEFSEFVHLCFFWWRVRMVDATNEGEKGEDGFVCILTVQHPQFRA